MGKLYAQEMEVALLLVPVQLAYLTNHSTDKHKPWWRDEAL